LLVAYGKAKDKQDYIDRAITIYKVMDSGGQFILPQFSNYPEEEASSLSRSTLKWPYQPQPTETAWKHWKQAISMLYLHTSSNQLRNPPGEWDIDHMNIDWDWTW